MVEQQAIQLISKRGETILSQNAMCQELVR